MNAHVAMLRDLLDDFGTRGFTAERAALDAAIRALSADRGEAGYVDADELCVVQGHDDVPRLVAGGREIAAFIPGSWPQVGAAMYELGKACGHTPPSPAESAECRCPQHGSWIAADDVKRLTRTIDVAINGEAGAAKQASLCDVTAQIVRMFTDAAPSQVSDAVREAVASAYPKSYEHPDDPITDIANAVIAAQPQPGRVEGMGDGLQGHAGTIVGWLRDGVFIGADADDNVSSYMDRGWQAVAVVPPSTAFALPEAAVPTAGGDA